MAAHTAIVAYVPVLHEGYRALFAREPDAEIYVLGREVTKQFRPLVKDLRALEPELVCKSIISWKTVKSCEVATADTLTRLAADGANIIMPDEDISHDLTEKYFSNSKVEFAPVFLRWDRRASDRKERVKGDRQASRDEAFDELMRKANALAARSSDLWRRVGALIVRDGKPLLEAWNRTLPPDDAWAEGDPRNNFSQGDHIETAVFMHAEAGLVAQAARQGISLEGTDLFITTFPCPICAKLLVTAGIRRCYFATGYAMLDAERLFHAAGVEMIHVKIDLPDNHPELWVPYPEKA